MTEFWENFLVEIGFLSLLGIAYYFYQKKKILTQEKNKIPDGFKYILQCALIDQDEKSNPELENLISVLDDYQKEITKDAPYDAIKKYSNSTHCSAELKQVISDFFQDIKK